MPPRKRKAPSDGLDKTDSKRKKANKALVPPSDDEDNHPAPEKSAQASHYIDRHAMNPNYRHQVYVVRPTPTGVCSNVGEVAGYLGCRDIKDYYTFCQEAQEILNSILQHQADGYGYSKEPQLTLASILTFANQYVKPDELPFDKDFANFRDVLRCHDLNSPRYPTGRKSGHMRASVIWLRHAYALIHIVGAKNGRWFPGSWPHSDEAKTKVVLGMHTEDLSRFHVLLGFMREKWREDRRKEPGQLSYLAKCARGGLNLSSKKDMIQPLFKYSDEAPPPTKSERDTQSYAIGIQSLMHKLSKDPIMRGLRGKGEVSETDQARMDEITANLGTGASGKGSKKKKRANANFTDRLAAIDDEQVDKAIHNLCAGLTVLYDRTEAEAMQDALDTDQAREATSLATTLGELGGGTDGTAERDWRAAMKEKSDNDEAFAQLAMQYGVDEDALKETTKEAAVNLIKEKGIVKVFQKFQSAINSVSAQGPEYDQAMRELGLEAVDVEDGKVPLAKHYDIQLLPHQVVGVAFLVGMLLSNLHAGLLMDETGLGKTIQALTADDCIRDKIRQGLKKHGLLADEATIVEFLPEKRASAVKGKGKKTKKPVDIGDHISSEELSDSDSETDSDSDSGVDEDGDEDGDEEDDARAGLAKDSYYSEETTAAMQEAFDYNESVKAECKKRGISYFQPTMVYAPSGSTDVWLNEISLLFPHRKMKSFLSAGGTSKKAAMGTDFAGSGRDLMRYLKALPVDNPQTGEVIIVTSYTTASARLLRHFVVMNNGKRYPLTNLTPQECEECNIDPADFEALLAEGKGLRGLDQGDHVYELRIDPGLVGTSIWDEVHRLRNMETQQLYTLIKMRHERVLLLTASPFARRLRDLTSILQIVAETSVVTQPQDARDSRTLTINEYERLLDLLKGNGGSFLSAPEDVRIQLSRALDPVAYKKIMAEFDDSPAIVRRVVPTPLSVLGIRRVTGQTVRANGVDVVIAGDLPPFHCTVVELAQNEYEQVYYGRAHKAKFGQEDSFMVEAGKHPQGIDAPVSLNVEQVETEGRENIDKRRRLQVASNNAGADNMNEYRIEANAKEVQKWYEEHAGDQGGFLFYHAATNENWGPPPTDRVSQAAYIATPSSKLQYVAKEAHRLNKNGEKLVIYCDWPGNVWHTKLLLDVLGMKTGRVSAGQSAKERAKTIDTFNDPHSTEIMNLVCSSRSAAESYNFQKGCHNIIIMDIVNFNTIMQIIGRCFRIQQKFPQFIKVLMLDGSYDQVLLAHGCTHMVAQMAATSGGAFQLITPEMAQAELEKDAGFHTQAERIAANNRPILDVARELLYDRDVHGKVRRNFGLRSDRDNVAWSNPKAPDAKLLIESERDYYMSKGGRVAEQVQKRLAELQRNPDDNITTPKGVKQYEDAMNKSAKKDAQVAALRAKAGAKADRKRAREESGALNEEDKKRQKMQKHLSKLRKYGWKEPEGSSSDPLPGTDAHGQRAGVSLFSESDGPDADALQTPTPTTPAEDGDEVATSSTPHAAGKKPRIERILGKYSISTLTAIAPEFGTIVPAKIGPAKIKKDQAVQVLVEKLQGVFDAQPNGGVDDDGLDVVPEELQTAVDRVDSRKKRV